MSTVTKIQEDFTRLLYGIPSEHTIVDTKSVQLDNKTYTCHKVSWQRKKKVTAPGSSTPTETVVQHCAFIVALQRVDIAEFRIKLGAARLAIDAAKQGWIDDAATEAISDLVLPASKVALAASDDKAWVSFADGLVATSKSEKAEKITDLTAEYQDASKALIEMMQLTIAYKNSPTKETAEKISKVFGIELVDGVLNAASLGLRLATMQGEVTSLHAKIETVRAKSLAKKQAQAAKQ